LFLQGRNQGGRAVEGAGARAIGGSRIARCQASRPQVGDAALGGNVRNGEQGTTVVYADRFVPDDEKKRARETGEEAQAIPRDAANESPTDPTPRVQITRFDRRQPTTPRTKALSRGRAGINQRKSSMAVLELHQVYPLNVERGAVAENHNDDRQADGRFGGCNHNHEENKNLAADLLPSVGESNERKVYSV